MVLIGAGLPLLSRLTPTTSAVMGSVARSQLGVASGTIGTMRFLGQALSIAVLGAVASLSRGAKPDTS